MGFCKENEKGICKPFSCRKADCPKGEELRNLPLPPRCGEVCAWMKRGINEKNSCKDISCPIENIIVTLVVNQYK